MRIGRRERRVRLLGIGLAVAPAGRASKRTLPRASLSPTAASPTPTTDSPSPSAAYPANRGSSATSLTWAGYRAIGRRITSASATWVQQRLDVRGRGERRTYVWVGLDGRDDRLVEQTRTEADR